MIMIFRCQDVSLALCVLMCTFKMLQLTASALRERERESERKQEEGKKAGFEGRQAPLSILLLANKGGGVGDKVLEDKLQVKWGLTLGRGDTG